MTDHVDTATRERHIPVDLTQPIMLEVHNPNGDVTVRAADRSDVFISFSGPEFPNGWGDEAMMAVEAHGNRIAVRANPHWGGGWGGFAGEVDLDAIVGQVTRAFRMGGPWFSGKSGKVRFGSGHNGWSDIQIELPRASNGRLEIHTASGDLRVEGVTSEIALHTASGDARAVRVRGDLDLHTASGDLTIEEAAGHFTAHTANGDIRVSASQIDGFQVQTASGDIFIDALLSGERSCSAQTASGDVRLTLRRASGAGEEPSATLAFHTVSGEANVGQAFRKVDRRRWQVGRGDRPQIDITTVSGDLTAEIAASQEPGFVKPAEVRVQEVIEPPMPPAPPAPVMPAPPVQPPAPAAPDASWTRSEVDRAAGTAEAGVTDESTQGDATRLAVLEAVERGEIDVEEALRRLEAADPNADQ